MTNPTKLRTQEDVDRFKLALVPIDAAFWASEQKWGVGRLERLQGPETLAAYRRGWDAYRVALEDGDGAAIEAIGPKMIAALAFMDGEASAAGHKPLAPEAWEAPMGDGTVLVVVRTGAEASAVIRASHASDGASYETTLPPDIAVTVRHQHEGRALVVVTLAEIVRLMRAEQTKLIGTKWEGGATQSGVVLEEMTAHDTTRQGYPLSAPLAGSVAGDLGF